MVIKYLIFFLSLIAITAIDVFSQQLVEGKITNQEGEILPFATVYVKETGFGPG